MAPSSEYHKRSHSRSEVLRFSSALKNAGSVYYRRYTICTIAFLKMAQEVLVRGITLCWPAYCTFAAWAAAIRSLLIPNCEGPHSVRCYFD